MKYRNYNKIFPIGLDIGSTAIRAVQLCFRRSLSVYSALELPRHAEPSESIPADSDSSSTLERESDIDSLCELIRKGAFYGNDVILHCPAEKLDLRPVTLPVDPASLSKSTLLSAVRLQLQDHLPFPAEHAVIDVYPSSRSDGSGAFTVIAVSADSRWVRRRLELLRLAHLRCHAVDSLPGALARLASLAANKFSYSCPDSQTEPVSAENKNRCFPEDAVLHALIDIGYTGSTLIVWNSCGPVFSRRFPFGGKLSTEILSQRLMLDFDPAETVKLAHGLDFESRKLRRQNTSQEDPASSTITLDQPDPPRDTDHELAKTLFAALQTDLAVFVEGLIRSLNYIIAEYPGAELQKILLTGAASHTARLTDYLTEQFEIPVELLDHHLLRQITAALPASRAESGRWTAALGLALGKEALSCLS